MFFVTNVYMNSSEKYKENVCNFNDNFDRFPTVSNTVSTPLLEEDSEENNWSQLLVTNKKPKVDIFYQMDSRNSLLAMKKILNYF